MKDLKEKTFTEGCENSPQERDREENYNPNREIDDATWRRLISNF